MGLFPQGQSENHAHYGLKKQCRGLEGGGAYDGISIYHFSFFSSNDKAWSLGREQGGAEKGPETGKEPAVCGECGRGASGALRMTGEV